MVYRTTTIRIGSALCWAGIGVVEYTIAIAVGASARLNCTKTIWTQVNIIKQSIEGVTIGSNPINFDAAKNVVTEDVTRFLFQKTAKKPIVIPVILGV